MEKLIIFKEPTNQVKNADDIFKKIKKINIDYKQENFIIFYLNNNNKIITSEVLFKGGIDSCLVCPNTIFRNALKHNSNQLIIAHNHPSGNLKPSCEDKEIYQKLRESGEIIKIKVLDSIIFNKKEFYNMLN